MPSPLFHAMVTPDASPPAVSSSYGALDAEMPFASPYVVQLSGTPRPPPPTHAVYEKVSFAPELAGLAGFSQTSLA